MSDNIYLIILQVKRLTLFNFIQYLNDACKVGRSDRMKFRMKDSNIVHFGLNS